MTFYVDNEVDAKFDFDFEEVAREVAEAVLKEEECEYDVEISLTITGLGCLVTGLNGLM